MDEKLLRTVREKGLLVEKEVFDLIESFHSVEAANDFLEEIERVSGQKMITSGVVKKNVGVVKRVVGKLPSEDKEVIEKTIVKLGISLEVTKERSVVENKGETAVQTAVQTAKSPNSPLKSEGVDYQVVYSEVPERKLEVKDFVGHFRARYQEIQRMLMSRPELQQNLISLGKLSGNRQTMSFIGIVTEKRITKNKNLIVKFEDLTGEISALVKQDNEELFPKADELQLDDIVGIRASGNNELAFIHEIVFPEVMIHEKMKFEEDANIVFLSDLHCGSDRHLKKSFDRFLEWLNGDDEEAKKVKYIFFVGDNVDGVGVFPGQEDVLDLKSMNEQYGLLASYLSKVPKNITMFMCPGQHDATWVGEPQPLIDKKYAPQLYEIENLVLVTNPSWVKLKEGEKEFKILMYHGASLNFLINGMAELREMNAYLCPAKAVKHLLKRRHLAPSHGVSHSIVYTPNGKKDHLVISEMPDVLCTGEVHRLDVESYNGVLIVTGSCWQAQTLFEEKTGHVPEPGRVAVMNLKNRGLKVYDFLDDEEKDANK